MKSIVLIGFMGTGKTAAGRMLAQRLQMRFVDVDRLIEQRSGMSITEIFDRFGEPHFRRIEKEVVSEISKDEGLVVATGGGIVLESENMTRLRKMGSVIHLFARPNVIADRTRDESYRPLLETDDREEKIARLLVERMPLYAGADCTIDTSDLSVEDVVERVVRYVGEPSHG